MPDFRTRHLKFLGGSVGEWPFQTGDNDTRSNYDPSDPLRLIAKYQRWVIFSVLVGSISGGLSLAIAFEAISLPDRIAIAFDLATMPIGGFMILSAYMLAHQFYNDMVAVACAMLMYVPLLGLIILLLINHKATRYLTRRGVKVGLFGASLKQL